MDLPRSTPSSTSMGKPPSQEIYRSTKTYDHTEGLSCCFRQWKVSHSHCRLIHGYALAFKFIFATDRLDEHNWCLDFGGLKPVKEWLKHMFDHTMLVAKDDPELPRFEILQRDGLIEMRVIPTVGCEGTAKYVFDFLENYTREQTKNRVWLESVEVKEHGGNSAIYSR
ncbi:6-pyruvoyl trahydropterin synthase family protein [Microvirga brassicacearum]|nr:6-carboxytetrahydropterin synthase [Microvirga brassicacearum]